MSANGRVDPADLVAISGTHLSRTTAAAFSNMAAACKAATGESLDIVNGLGGYRSLADQRVMYENRRLYLPIVIAPPGSSTHGFGTALDLTITCFTPEVREWLRRNLASYGFQRPPADDPRHFLHLGKTTGPARPTAPAGDDGTPITPEELEMPDTSFIRHENGTLTLLDNQLGPANYGPGDTVGPEVAALLHGAPKPMTAAQWQRAVSDCASRAARHQALAAPVDSAGLAREVAALLTPVVAEAVKAVGLELDDEQSAAVEAAVRRVFASAGSAT